MTTLALAAPATAISGSPGGGAITGVALPAAETSTATFTAASVPNNGSVLIRAVCTTSGTISFTCQKTIFGGTIASTVFQQSVTAGTYIYGPFPVYEFNDVNGLLQMTGTFFGGASNTIGAYQLPGSAAGV